MVAYGYMLHDIPSLRWETDFSTIKRMVKAPLEHRFGNHAYCDKKWCRVLQAEEEEKFYMPPESDPFFCKNKDKLMYKQLKEIMVRFTSEEVIRESLHWHSTQKNEAMNQVIARLCPKNKHLSESLTLLTRVCVAISYTNVGMKNFYTKVLNELGISMDVDNPMLQLLCKTLNRLDQMRTERMKKKQGNIRQSVFIMTRQKLKKRYIKTELQRKSMGLTKLELHLNVLIWNPVLQ